MHACMHAFLTFVTYNVFNVFADFHLQEKQREHITQQLAKELTGTGARRLSVSMVMDVSCER